MRNGQPQYRLAFIGKRRFSYLVSDRVMNCLLDALKGIVGSDTNKTNEGGEERRNARRREFDRMMDLTISGGNNLYTGTFHSRLKTG